MAGNISKIFSNSLTWIFRSKVSVVGAIVVSILLPILFVSILFDLSGIIENPYFGFLLYLVMAPLLVVGIILILAGAFFSRGSEDIGIFAVEYLKEQFSRPGRYSRIRRLIYLIVAIVFIIFFIIGLASYGGFHYTSSVNFCGQFCHTIMDPQMKAYQQSPHSKISCVECHLGKDAGWAARSRFSGIKQLFAVMTDSYTLPIQSPITELRPGRKTCEQCHLPEMFHNDRLVVKDKFLSDEKNTHVQTVLLMRVGSGEFKMRSAHGIHWHVSRKEELYYRHSDRERKQITSVRLVEKGKKDIVYRSIDAKPLDNEKDLLRKMDCVDCHNRPTHIFLGPEEALDQKIATGIIPSYLPFIKRQALELINQEYASVEDAKENISRSLNDWYHKNYPEFVERNATLLAKAIKGTSQAYEDNVFPKSKIGWGTYQNFIGHKDDTGCFRCHGKLQEEETGRMISKACDTCHILLAVDEADPDVTKLLGGRNFPVLQAPEKSQRH